MPGEGLKLAQQVTASEIYDLILHLREDMPNIVNSLVSLPGELYPRKDAAQIEAFLSNMQMVFSKLSDMAIRSGVSAEVPEGAKFIERKDILKDLLNRRVITKRRLNTCLTKCSGAFDNWAGRLVYDMFGTVWLATREGLKSITPLMHDYYVEQPRDQTQSQSQPQSTPPEQKKTRWGKNKK